MMNVDEGAAVTDRRQWFESVARYTALGGLVAVTACLAARGGSSSCPRRTLTCRDCRLLSRCELPAGRAARGVPENKERADG